MPKKVLWKLMMKGSEFFFPEEKNVSLHLDRQVVPLDLIPGQCLQKTLDDTEVSSSLSLVLQPSP